MHSLAARPGDAANVSAPPIRRALRDDRRARVGIRCPVPSREILGPRAADARELRRLCGRPSAARGAAAAPHDPPARDRHPGRQGRAPRQGRFDEETVYDADPSTPPGAGSTAGRGRCMSSTSTEPAAASRRTSSTSSGSPARRRPGPGRRRTSDDRRGRPRVRGGRQPGRARHRCIQRRRLPRRRRSRATATGSSVSIDARNGLLATSGWTEQTEIPIEPVVERMGAAACGGSCSRASIATACSPAPTSTVSRRSRRRFAGSFVYSGGVSLARGSRALARAAAGQSFGCDRRQGAIRAAVHRRGGAGRRLDGKRYR